MTDCPHLRRADIAIQRLQRKLMAETSPRNRSRIRIQMIEFGKQMDAHRECRCQELRESA